MSSGTIILIIAIVVILVVAYIAGLIVRKRNDNLLDALEGRKDDLFNLPVNEEVEAVKSLHLIGQSQVSFREWNQKWVDISLNSFADIENHILRLRPSTILSVLSAQKMPLKALKVRLI